MTELSPEAINLMTQHTDKWIAERVVELEANNVALKAKNKRLYNEQKNLAQKQKRLDDTNIRVDQTIQKQMGRLLELLRRYEWKGPYASCPDCGWSKETGHPETCDLNIALKTGSTNETQ